MGCQTQCSWTLFIDSQWALCIRFRVSSTSSNPSSICTTQSSMCLSSNIFRDLHGPMLCRPHSMIAVDHQDRNSDLPKMLVIYLCYIWTSTLLSHLTCHSAIGWRSILGKCGSCPFVLEPFSSWFLFSHYSFKSGDLTFCLLLLKE
jgi:hypothetical protein